MAKTYIKDIPDDIWKKFKIFCVAGDAKINDELVKLIKIKVKRIERRNQNERRDL